MVSTKGGVGKSTFASNLAYALDQTVVLIDLDVPYSSLASLLRVNPRNSWNNWRGSVKDIAIQVRETLHLISNPVEEIIRPDMDLVKQVVMQSKKEYQYCVVDCGSRADDYVAEIVKLADRVIVVSSIDQMSIRNNLMHVREMDTQADVEWALNRVNGKIPFPLSELEKESGNPVAALLPEAKDVWKYAVKGELIVEKKPRALWSKRVREYADKIVGRS